MLLQVYEAVELLADALESQGHYEDAKKLRDDMYGATSTEILMALRFHLRQMNAGNSISAELRTRITDLHTAICEILGPPHS